MTTTPAEPPTDVVARGTRPRSLHIDAVGAITIVGASIGAALVLGAMRAGADMLTKVVIGIVLALAFDPVVGAVRRLSGWTRGPAVGLVVAFVALLFVSVALVMGPAAVEQAQQFADELPQTARDLYDLPFVGQQLEDRAVADNIEQWAADLPAEISDDTVSRVTDAVVGGLASTVIVLLVAITVLIDGDSLVARARRIIPAHRLEMADDIGRTSYAVIAQYFAGSLLVASLAGLVILALGLLLGVPLTPLAAVWAVLTNLIPQIGGFLGGFVFVTLALTQGLTTGLIALGCYLVYMNLENHVIQPAVVGERVDLSPPTTMLAALIGGAAAGIPGALIATPLVGAAKQLWSRRRRDFDL